MRIVLFALALLGCGPSTGSFPRRECPECETFEICLGPDGGQVPCDADGGAR